MDFLTVSVLHSIVNHSTFFVFIQKRKKEKKKSSRVRKDLQHSSCQLFKPQADTCPILKPVISVVFLILNQCQTSNLTNPALIVFWSSILHLPPPHRVLIPPAVPPQNLTVR